MGSIISFRYSFDMCRRFVIFFNYCDGLLCRSLYNIRLLYIRHFDVIVRIFIFINNRIFDILNQFVFLSKDKRLAVASRDEPRDSRRNQKEDQ